uniref:NADH-ubiquinone oxidoreductase chain 3 n=1 Tax=Sinopyrophorus schimmeli TaxID=2488820 RepID=A0A3G5FPV6_9COLE|nr:NADH dehydrogenase subunit 3 [Elateridae sp. JWH-2018]
MLLIWFVSLALFTLSFVVMMVANLTSKKTFIDREKSSPFECGFDPKTSARIPFSLQFFLIAVIFLIFDVEITLLLPLILTMQYTTILSFSFITTFFIMILIGGLYHEWAQGALNWAL